MLLLGGCQRNPAEGDYSLIGSMFDRLPKEARHRGNLTRFVGFDRYQNDQDHLRFFGIEVDDIEEIPAGLVAWELTDQTWTIWQTNSHQNRILWQEDLTWLWLDRASTNRRVTGEFSACGPAEWAGHNVSSEPRPFWMFAHVPFDLNNPCFRDDIYLVEYDPAWPAQFAELAGWLRTQLGPDVAWRVEHFGSTAIPGMPAKPILDVLVEIPSFEAGRRRAIPRLHSERWEYWWYGDHLVFFQRKELMGERVVHVHLAPTGHPVWKGLAFRDFLRTHPAEAVRYAALKRRLAQTHRQDREAYTQAKTDFVTVITTQALHES